LTKTINLHHVKFIEGKIAHFKSRECVSLNISCKGMKVLVEQKLREKVAIVFTLYGDPSVYYLQISSQDLPSIKNIEEVEKIRLAKIVRKNFGWDNPMLVKSITAQVGGTWNAFVNDKRRLKNTRMEDSQGKEKKQRRQPISTCSRQENRKEVRFQTNGFSSQQPS
jgi:hypothetical protein